MKKTKIRNSRRSKEFGVVINPKIYEIIDWKTLSNDQIVQVLNESYFANKFDITKVLNNMEVKNVNQNLTKLENFEGQLELGDETNIPHYQLAIKMETICTKKPILEYLEKSLCAHINIEPQFNFEEMVKYTTKETPFLSKDYSGRIYKEAWRVDFLERKPSLRKVLNSPYPWQSFFNDEILSKESDDRIIDWFIDPVGNTGES